MNMGGIQFLQIRLNVCACAWHLVAKTKYCANEFLGKMLYGS